MNLILIGISFVTFVPFQVFASYPFYGSCIKHSAKRNFDMSKYAGIWYEIEKYFSYGDYGVSCISYRFRGPSKKRDGERQFMTFIKKGVRKSYFSDAQITAVEYGHLVSASTNNAGRLEKIISPINFGKEADNIANENKEAYWIFDTDYANYSVVWSCVHAGIMNFQKVAFLARERDPPILTRAWAHGAIKKKVLSIRLLVSTDQEDCNDLFPENNKTYIDQKSNV